MNESSTLSQFLEGETVCASAWKVEEYDGYRTDSFAESQIAVSYTHLTLPTILLV